MSDIQPWQDPKTAPTTLSRSSAEMRSATQAAVKYAWLWAWWPALVWAAVIFTMSTDTFSAVHTAAFFDPILRWLKPDVTAHQLMLFNHYIRKTAHFTEYFVFAVLLYRGIRGARAGWQWSWAVTALFAAACYAALDEIHQAFVASREAKVSDAALDSVGAFFAVLVLWLWFRRRRSAPL